jgi:hypothetical protein
MQALTLASLHVYVFIADGGAVPAIYAGDDETAVAHIVRRLHAEPGGGAQKRMAVFDVGRAVCSLDEAFSTGDIPLHTVACQS